MPKIPIIPLQNFISEWPEVFEDLHMSAVPLIYLESIQFEFVDGRIWEINIKEQLSMFSDQNISNNLTETFREYHDEIVKLNVKVDVAKIKTDVIQQTRKLL